MSELFISEIFKHKYLTGPKCKQKCFTRPHALKDANDFDIYNTVINKSYNILNIYN